MDYRINDCMNLTVEEKAFITNVGWEISNTLRGVLQPHNFVYFILYYKSVDKHDEKGDVLYQEALQASHFTYGEVKERVLDDLAARYDSSVFKALTLQYSDSDFFESGSFSGVYTTPPFISKLALQVLNIKENETVMDLCSGRGSFLTAAYLNNPEAKYYGVEIDSYSVLTSRIRSYLLGNIYEVELKNVFAREYNAPQYDKVFANYPFGMRIKELGKGAEYVDRLLDLGESISRATSSDWVFNQLAVDTINENGKAVCIMTNGSTSNTIDKGVRSFFVEAGYVEAIITLPPRMFAHTQIPVTMIVLSHNNNTVKMVDGYDFYQKGRRNNELSDEDIDSIIKGLNQETEYSRTVSIDELRQEDYVLSPSRYLSVYLDKLAVENGKKFGDVIKSITRGAGIKASQLDEMTVYNETDYQYLMLSNIQKGMIQSDLPYLSHIPEMYDKYCLKENNLILSKNGYPYKVAVVGKTNKKILANGNLFIIELDEEQVNPFYIKALFESEKGIALLKSITVGATIPNIGVTQLQNLIIPVPSMDEQNKIAEEYKAVEDEIKLLQLRIEKAVARRSQIFDREREA